MSKLVQTSLLKHDWLLLRAEAAEKELSLYELVRDILITHIQIQIQSKEIKP